MTSGRIMVKLSREEKEAFEKMRNSDNVKPSSASKNNFFKKFKNIFQ